MTTQTQPEKPASPQEEELDDRQLDARLRAMGRAEALALPPARRMRWFHLVQVQHAELARVAQHLHELLDPCNDVKIISIIGPTGIGKTTLATTILTRLVEEYAATRKTYEVPVVYVAAPANGEKSMSWKTLYRRLMLAAGERFLDLQRAVEVRNGEMLAVRSERQSLAHLREHLEAVIRHRNVRVMIIDEAMHLLRFHENTVIMDTLKSLADIHHTKLVLIGTYQIAPLMVDYGQLARRSAILHYRRYAVRSAATAKPEEPTEMEKEFKRAVRRLQNQWPCVEVPDLERVWQPLMRASLGSVGLLKSQLLQLAHLQMMRTGETFDARDLVRAMKPPKQLAKIEQETAAGEADLSGASYGEADFGSDDEVKQLFERLTGKAHG